MEVSSAESWAQFASIFWCMYPHSFFFCLQSSFGCLLEIIFLSNKLILFIVLDQNINQLNKFKFWEFKDWAVLSSLFLVVWNMFWCKDEDC